MVVGSTPKPEIAVPSSILKPSERLVAPGMPQANQLIDVGDHTAMGHVPTVPAHVIGPIGQKTGPMAPVTISSCATVTGSCDVGSFWFAQPTTPATERRAEPRNRTLRFMTHL